MSNTAGSMEELLSKHKASIRSFRVGELVEGTVVSSSHNKLLLDIGGKSEGVISGKELEDTERTARNLKVGDKLLAKVVQSENDSGYTVLSLRRAEKERHWRDFQKYQTEGTTLSARVLEFNKGGLVVDVLGAQGFIPLSRLDRNHFEPDVDLANVAGSLVGQSLEVRVIEVNEAQNRLVLSEPSTVQKGQLSPDGKPQVTIKDIDEGATLTGTVTTVTPFGVFVDIGGFEGLVHISELTWDKVASPAKLYKTGDTVSVKVLSVDKEAGKIALSVRALAADPWEDVSKKYPEGKIVQGIVSKIAPFGAFVNLEPGVDGLVHVSETVGPMKEGEEVEAVVVTSDAKSRKLGLSVRRLQGLKS